MALARPSSQAKEHDAVMRMRYEGIDRAYKGEVIVDVVSRLKAIPGATVLDHNESWTVVLVGGRKGLLKRLTDVFGDHYEVSPQTQFMQMGPERRARVR